MSRLQPSARYDRLRAIVAYAVKRAEALGFVVADGGMPKRGKLLRLHRAGRCLCPNGAVALLAHKRRRARRAFGLHYPMCDEAAVSYAYLLGGKSKDWMDEARALEVGFDGSDPKEEQVPTRDRFYQLGQQYREGRG